MRTKLTMAGVLAAALCGWTAEGAQRPHGPASTEALTYLLGLSAERAASVAQESASYRTASRDLYQKIEALKGKMEQANAASDRGALGSLLLAEWEVNQEIARLRQAYQERLTALLMPAQLEKLRLVVSVVSLLHAEAPFLRDAGIDRGFLGEDGGEAIERRPHAPGDGSAKNVPGGTIRHSSDVRPQRHEAARQ